MKKYFYLFLLLIAVRSNAQHINSIQVIPANPTTMDTISVIVDMWFSSGPCDQHTQQYSVVGNSIYCSTLHCTGMLTVICNDADTFKINPLPAGSYTTYVQVDAGGLPSPCTPGIVAGDADSVSFTVTPITAVADPADENQFSLTVRSDAIHLSFENPENIKRVLLTDESGRLILATENISSQMKVDKPRATGVYFLTILNKTGHQSVRKIFTFE